MGKKRITHKYWGRVISKGWEMIRDKIREGVFGVLIILSIYIAIPYILGLGTKYSLRYFEIISPNPQSIYDDLLIGIYMLIWMIIFYFASNFIVIPPVLYDEMGGFVEEPITIQPERHPEEMGNQNYYRALKVNNDTPYEVKECMLRLMEVIDVESSESIIRRDENLTWSNRERESAGDLPKTIPGHNNKICDFAGRVLIEGDTERKAFLTLAFGPTQFIPVGIYRAIVQISGKWQEQDFNYEEEMYFSYDGLKIFLSSEVPEENLLKENK